MAECDLGAFELAPLALEIDLSADNETPVAGARIIPAANIPGAVSSTQTLFDSSLEASPLNGFPINAAPLNGFPLTGSR